MDATSKVNGFVPDWPQSPTAVSTAKHAPTLVRVISISFQARLLLESKTVRNLKAFVNFLKTPQNPRFTRNTRFLSNS
jgi:hypothetical protein